MPYFHKRTEKSVDCKLDEPVPLGYYSSLAPGKVPRFHPRTMRDLIILKSKEFIRNKDKKGEANDKDLENFINDFKTELFKIYEIGKDAHEEKKYDWNIFMGEEEGDYFLGLNDDVAFREREANLTEDDELVVSSQQDEIIKPEPTTPSTPGYIPFNLPSHFQIIPSTSIRAEATLRNPDDDFTPIRAEATLRNEP